MHEIGLNQAADMRLERAADTVMLLALMLARRTGAACAAPMAGRTLCLVGFDHVARAVARRARRGFAMRVLALPAREHEQTIAAREGIEISPSLDHSLQEADFVSLHSRRGDDGATMINAHRLNQMTSEACLINTVHGGLVDEQALLHALWFETIGGAGIAVPRGSLDRLHELRACENAIVLSPPSETRHVSLAPPASKGADNVIQLFERRQQHI